MNMSLAFKVLDGGGVRIRVSAAGSIKDADVTGVVEAKDGDTLATLVRRLEVMRIEIEAVYTYLHDGCRAKGKDHSFDGDPSDKTLEIPCRDCQEYKPRGATLPGFDLKAGHMVVPAGYEPYCMAGAA